MAASLSSIPRLIAIAGAGPAGLSLACLLEHYHQPFVIIDPNPPAEDRLSKATGLHRNTLRLLGKVGLVDEIAKHAIELNANRMYVDGNLIKTITFEQGECANDRNLSIDQYAFETILFSRLLRSSTLFGKKIVGFDQSEEGITIEVEDCLTSTVERIRAKYLVGADGAKSLVRKIIGSSFDGVTTPDTGFTFDAIPFSSLPANEMAMYTTKEERLVVIPLPKGRCKFSGRITGISFTEDRSTECSSEIKDLLTTIVAHRSKILIDPATISGLSFYHTASRIASSIRDRRVFLIGDAAHIFFPAGGYGLNVAIEDAFTLCWRLVLTEAGLSPVSVFESFEKERSENARSIQSDATQKRLPQKIRLRIQKMKERSKCTEKLLVYFNR